MSSDKSLEDFFRSGAFDLERDFPEEYPAIRAIVSKVAPWAIAEENDKLRYELADFVYGYRRDQPRSEYRKQATELEDKVKELIDNLDSVLRMIENLDSQYNRRMVEFMTKSPLEDDVNYNLGHVLRDLENAQTVASYFRLAIHAATRFEAKPSGRSRPPLPQFVPAVQLMDLWERLTGTEVVTPKGVAAGKNKPEATQPSTEFVRLGLKMIDPKITPANTMTLIKRALTEKKENRLTRLIDLIEMPEWQDLFSAVERVQPSGAAEPTDES
jgi:hypothetical protein